MKLKAKLGVFPVMLALVLVACATPAPMPTPVPTAKPAAPTAAPPAAAPKPAAATPVAKPTTPPATPKPAAEKPLAPPVKVKLAVSKQATEAALFIALEKGYFKDEGLDVELVNFAGGAQMIPALAIGEVHVGSGSSSAGFINAIQRELNFKIVADRGHSAKGMGVSGLGVRKDLVDSGAYKGFADLKGKTIASNATASSGEFLAAEALRKGGLKEEDAKYIAMPFPDLLAAFSNKAIDAAVFGEPLHTQAIDRGLVVRVNTTDQIYLDYQMSLLIYSPKLMTEMPEAAKRFAVAYLKGIRTYKDAFEKNKGKSDVVSVITKNTPVTDPALVSRILPTGFDADGRVNIKSLQDEQDWYLKRGYIKDKIDYNKVVDYQFMNYAVDRLGAYK
ncbi:MAG: ABC transporter substrate-binding protein [Chloroflexi bacterium]|nr:ABC transporter substrate-binding protein [Chloroflexota bacterium]